MSYSKSVIFRFISDQDEALIESELPASLSRFEPGEDVTFRISLNDDHQSFTFFTDNGEELVVTPEIMDQAIINADDNTLSFPFEDGNLELSFWQKQQSNVPA